MTVIKFNVCVCRFFSFHEKNGQEGGESKAEKWSSIKQIEIGILVVSLNENKLDLKLLSCFFLIVKSASVFYKHFKNAPREHVTT